MHDARLFIPLRIIEYIQTYSLYLSLLAERELGHSLIVEVIVFIFLVNNLSFVVI